MSQLKNKYSSSPKKQRPTTAGGNQTVFSDATTLTNKLNSSLIREQEKDIEIERLMTTCKTLNQKCTINDDLRVEIEVLRRTGREQDQMIETQKEELSNYERTIQNYERTRVQQQKENSLLKDQCASLKNDLI
jgi:hypothetical protein